ncbi:MAG: SDR family oxidoreductase [Flavobacteriales bacterium]|nr:SDR family oxidoreductase [Flavobacteriales bacterium]
MNLPLEGKIIVITGATGRLGTAFCKAVLEAGANLVATDLDKPATQQKLRELQDAFGQDRVLPLAADTTNKESLDSCAEASVARFGRVDALVNNAYPRNANYGRRFEDVTYEDLVENVGLHAGGYFLACQRFLELFKRQGHGNIVNMSSIYGVVAPRFGIYAGTEMTMPVEYAVIKAGVLHLTKYIASYHRGQGVRIRCNAISPGGIRDAQPQEFLDRYNASATSKGMLDPKDINGALLFLLSDASEYVNGQNIVVDDGWTL